MPAHHISWNTQFLEPIRLMCQAIDQLAAMVFLHGSCIHWTLEAKTVLDHLPPLPQLSALDVSTQVFI